MPGFPDLEASPKNPLVEMLDQLTARFAPREAGLIGPQAVHGINMVRARDLGLQGLLQGWIGTIGGT